jgi:hypothetical protein
MFERMGRDTTERLYNEGLTTSQVDQRLRQMGSLVHKYGSKYLTPGRNEKAPDPLKPMVQADSPLLIGLKKKADRKSLVIRAKGNKTVASPTMGESSLTPTIF